MERLPQNSLKEAAKTSRIGDPVSLKAETSNTKPTDQDKPNKSEGEKSLKEIAQEKMDSGNPSQLGDPVSLKAEISDNEPTKDDRGALGTSEEDKERAKKEGEKVGRPKL